MKVISAYRMSRYDISHIQLYAIIFSAHNVITRTCRKRFASFLPPMPLHSLLLNQLLLLIVFIFTMHSHVKKLLVNKLYSKLFV
jgi:hypothetical protein